MCPVFDEFQNCDLYLENGFVFKMFDTRHDHTRESVSTFYKTFVTIRKTAKTFKTIERLIHIAVT